METVYVIEIIRYGNPQLGVYLYGVFSTLEGLHEQMVIYNKYRGGKYPSYRVTELMMDTESPFDTKSKTISC